MKNLWLLAALVFSVFYPSRSWAKMEMFQVALPAGYLSEVLELFPESQEVDPRLLDFQVDPNVHLHREAQITLTFLHEGAALHNSFGYFLYEDQDENGTITLQEILKKEEIFSEVVFAAEGGELSTGDTVNLGKFPKDTRLGFFLIAHASNQTEWTFYTIDSLNFDGHRHLAMRVSPDGENIVLGIEDLPWDRSDRDFNDILFSFTISPKAALQEVIEEGNIPGAPTPLPHYAPFVPESPKEVEPPAQAAEEAAVTLEGGGMKCGLSKETNQTRPRFFSWFCATCLVSLLAIRMFRAI